MSAAAAILVGIIALTASLVSFVLGMRVQARRNLSEYLDRMERIKKAENTAREALRKEMEKLETRKRDLRKLAWEDLLRKLK